MPNKRYHQLPKEKKDLINQAVLDEMARHTYEHLNLSNIVRDADISRGSLYQYFTDKYDLYFYYISYLSDIKKSFFDGSILSNKQLSFTQKLRHLFEASMAFNQHYPKLANIGLRLYESKDPLILELIHVARNQSQTLYADLMRDDPSLNHMHDFDKVGLFISDIFISMTQGWMKHQSIETFEHHMTLFIHILEGGLKHV